MIDAIDKVYAKAALIAHCVKCNLPVFVCGGVGGKTDASKLTVSDLAITEQDALLAKLRQAFVISLFQEDCFHVDDSVEMKIMSQLRVVHEIKFQILW